MSHSITSEQVLQIGRLSRIELSPAQVDEFAEQLAVVLESFDKLSELDTEGVEPMAHAVELTNVLQDDIVREGLTHEAALANAPARDGDLYKVPKVIGDSA